MKPIPTHCDNAAAALSILRAFVRPLSGLLVLSSFAVVGTLGAATVIGTQTYTTPGPYSYTVPANASQVVVKVWGGGGEPQGPDEAKSSGGAGGFVIAAYGVVPGQVINLVVGSGGAANASAVWRSGGFQVIAGGGGQGGDEHDGESGQGGGAAVSSASGPGSGPRAGGGPMNVSSGVPYSANGGPPENGGIGGSGYYGGEGGWNWSDSSGGGGCGGSNYFDTGNGYIAGSGISLGGDNTSPPGTDDPHYPGNRVGAGGDSWGSTGNGAVVILACISNQLPVATFTATPSSGRAPLSVSFASGSYDPDGFIVSHAWDFDNNGTTDASGVSAGTTYQNTGATALSLSPKLTVTDSDSSGATTSTTRAVTVYPPTSYTLTVQQGAVQGASPYYLPGSTVSVVANSSLATQLFANWSIVSGSGTFANASASSTGFAGTADSVVRANFGPTIPGSLSVSSYSHAVVNLSWTASVDDVVVTGYNIYRTWGGGTLSVGTSAGGTVTFSDTHVMPSTIYAYHVRAIDASSNLSGVSNTINVTTAALPDGDGDGVPDSIEGKFGTQNDPNPGSASNLNLKVHRPTP